MNYNLTVTESSCFAFFWALKRGKKKKKGVCVHMHAHGCACGLGAIFLFHPQLVSAEIIVLRARSL